MSATPELTTQDIERVRGTFDRFWSVSSQTAEIFYDRLFETAPALRPLFRSDMAEQQRKFVATLAAIVGNLDDEIALSNAVTLARQHAEYGVTPEHYPIVGQALMWSLERGLGEQWTPEAAASWSKAYAFLSDHMIRAAYPERRPT